MSSGECRRSARICELDVRRVQQAKRQNKGIGTSEVAIKQDVSTLLDSNKKRGRKKVKIRPVQDLVDDTAKNEVHEAVSWTYEEDQTNADHATFTSFRTAIPEKGKLQLLLSALQRRDSYGIFSQPVNSEEVEGYYDVIKEPMDFGTIAKKLNGGSYISLQEFEHDVYLVSSNAMLFNASNTIYYRQARAIKELAKKLFHALETDAVDFETECLTRRPGRRTKAEAGILNSHLSNEKVSMGHRGEGSSGHQEVDRRGTYRPWTSFLNENESLVTDVYSGPQPLNPVVDPNIAYGESLMKFVKDLGPTAQKVARQKVECFIDALNYQNASLNQQLQAPTNQIAAAASAQKGMTVAQSLNIIGSVAGSQKFPGGKFGIQSILLNGEKTSADNNMKIYDDSLSGGIAQASFSMEALGDSRWKQVQALSSNHQLHPLNNQISAAAFAQKGIKVAPSLIVPGSNVCEISVLHRSTVGGERTSTFNIMDIWDTSSGGITQAALSMETLKDWKGKKVLNMSGEFGMGTAFNEDIANQNIGLQVCPLFPTSGSGDENLGFLSSWNRNSNTDKYSFTNMMKDAANPSQTAQLGSSESKLLEFIPTRNALVSSPRWLPSHSLTEQSSMSQVNGSLHGIDSSYQGWGMHKSQAMVDGEGPSYTGNIGQGGQSSNWFKPKELEPQSVLDNWFQPQLSLADVSLSRGKQPMQQQSWLDFHLGSSSKI
ncbi:Bromodomain domain-containing protein [Cephalotus follicularis]|uniref:Bromodomain domain-containing protein n=1 Tax=Cephalotus follicularis TaxID=3775 RepID=A0A1Q3BIJ8_CEPFO|nr:Bromodomain domain-containing protein [Cephalotus follicularis]